MQEETINRLIKEAEDEEWSGETRYSHAVQVLTPLELLKQIDAMVQGDRRLSRPIIYRRALRLYLNVLKIAGKPAPRKWTPSEA